MEALNFERGAGILCHISSLPGEYGIGSLGKSAYDFVDALSSCGVKYWQILPLVQTGYGDSPYQSVCCFSGNPYFIDLPTLCKQGLLSEDEVAQAKMQGDGVRYNDLYESRYALLKKAYARFNKKDSEFIAFIESGVYEDYALFMSLKERYGCSFDQFPEAYKYKENLAMFEFRSAVYKTDFCFWQFVQYQFQLQWQSLKAYANQKGVSFIGDMPLYVAYDSADVWGRPELFALDSELKPEAVAGVPPDYFSEDGQLWGNPLYNWDAMKAENYEWWIHRIAQAQKMYDIVRIDHFRGLDRYYAIPADHTTAKEGEWKKAYGLEMLTAAQNALGKLSVIAEDLGTIDEGVRELLKESGFPGMKVLLFAYDGNEENEYLPELATERSVTYTGTHDNDTALGYVNTLNDEEFASFVKRLRTSIRKQGLSFPVVTREDCAQALCLLAFSTKSQIAIVPVQDWLGLDNASRMNVPSRAEGNWQFRLQTMPTLRQRGWLKRYLKLTDRK